ncbi:MAG: hypothetical protein J6S85_18245 [Methanobrevibacter sp.]|nr:hypothetical protein [Methanobrevibacter sp.]
MANAFEYPGTNYEQGNYDYFITEVKEFNRKLDEYQAEVNQKLSDQDEEIAGFKNTVNGQINQLRGQLAEFENNINNWQDDFLEQYNQDYAALVAQVDRVVESMRDYVWDYMAENGEELIAGGQVVFTCVPHGVGEPITVETEVPAADIASLLNENKFQPEIVYIDNQSRFIPDSWQVISATATSLLIYMFGSTYGNSVLGNKRYKVTYQISNGSVLQAKWEEIATIRDPLIRYIDITVSGGVGEAYISASNIPSFAGLSFLLDGATEGFTTYQTYSAILTLARTDDTTCIVDIHGATENGTYRVVLFG